MKKPSDEEINKDKEVEIHPIHQEVELTDEGAKILEQILSDPNSPKGRAIGVRRIVGNSNLLLVKTCPDSLVVLE